MADDNFFDRVYQVVRLIPAGRVTSYGAIANYLGTKGYPRWMVRVMPCKPVVKRYSRQVPAHRVVNRQGLLTAKFHFGGNLMQQLLESEGIKVEDDQVQDFKILFWDPMIELAL